MRIGVISDTHIPTAANRLPRKVLADLKNVDLILHAGDLIEMAVLKKLQKIAPVKAVYGNMDNIKVQKTLPRKDLIETGRFKIGLIHGFGPTAGLLDRIREEFDNIDIIVFGHTHSPINEMKDGVLFFNPGSLTDKITAKFNSYGIIEINDEIKGEIIKL